MKYEHTSEITVDLIAVEAGDASVVRAARVSTLTDDRQGGDKLIDYLVRNRHGSPFEHNLFTWRVDAPIFMWREHHRHRIASYNEASGRYTVLPPKFYVPGPDRKMVQQGKPGAYEYVAGTEEQYSLVRNTLHRTSITDYAEYERLLDAGIAKEVARMCLPVNLMSVGYVTMNAWALMNFLSLRTTDPGSAFPSYPMAEIELVARQYEESFAEYMPLTHKAFCDNGRVAP